MPTVCSVSRLRSFVFLFGSRCLPLLFVFLLVFSGGCGLPNHGGAASASPDGTLVLGFSQLGAESAWRTSNTESISTAAGKAGIQLMYKEAEQKQENQIKAIRSFIAYQVDVIAFAPIVEEGWTHVLTEAKAAGIPVILTDRKIAEADESLYDCYIGSDFELEGKMAGAFLKTKYEGKPGPIRIAELFGTVGSSPTEGRSKGFHQAIGDDPRFVIVRTENGDFMRSKGKEQMAGILADGLPVDVLYAHNDSMALGAIQAMEEAGIKPGKDIVIISIDGEQEAIDALKAGKLNCVVECSPKLGPAIVETARNLKNGEVVPKNLYTKDLLFTEWDDLTALPPRGY